jgi:hypothetical protein
VITLSRTGHVARIWERRLAYEISVGKREGKRPLGRWKDNLNMDLQEVGEWHEMD